jgi:Terminase large subunit, ATPase domain
MPETFNQATLAHWRAEPATFIETALINPETALPFVLLDAEREFFKHAFRTDADGRLLFTEQVYAAPKKSGKTAFAALHLLTTTFLFGGRYAEAFCIANDLEQAQSRVFEACKRIVEASPLLRGECKVTADRITFVATGAVIAALAADYAGAAGAHPVISAFDELWAFTSERSRRLWDEMIPVPTRKISCRLTVTYAGFEGESELLQELYKRGLAQQKIGTDLYAGDGLLMLWSHVPLAPWQDERWLAEMRRSLRPNQYLRMIENRFVTCESSFVTMAAWDRCVDASLGPVVADTALPVWAAVDASTKHDSTAIVAVTWESSRQQVRLVFHRVFQPSASEPLDFEAAIESTLRDLKERFQVRKVLFDPWQMQATAQRLARAGLEIKEFPQTPANLTKASQNLFELITGGNLLAYPDAALRLAISRAVAVETPRGWRISKATQSHKIDIVVSLAMAAHAAVAETAESANIAAYLRMEDWVSGPGDELPADHSDDSWRSQQFAGYLRGLGWQG